MPRLEVEVEMEIHSVFVSSLLREEREVRDGML